MVGGTGFLANITMFWLFIHYTSIWYIYASVLSFSISTLIGYILHKNFTYKDETDTNSKKIIYFYLLNTFNILANALLMFILVDLLSIEKMISLIISNILISVYSYIVYKKIIFK